jgi:transcription antitermination factor NusG
LSLGVNFSHQSVPGVWPQTATQGQFRQWFAAYTTPRHEKAVVRHLDVREFESFLPLYTSVRRWKNGCQVAVERPLFPGYVFVCIERRSSTRVLEIPGVVSIVGSGRTLSALATHEIESLRAGLPQRRHEPHPYLATGDRVSVIGGPFMGMSGVLIRRKNHLRVVLTLDLIIQSVAVEIGIDEIEPFRN